ncbi:MAG TPA: rhodanese-like domain-containing protein [Steroidobacteraceae bacterium]|jgi:rhodanese-related sulfurtransferase|nr:rhodanese-like domain-containing protein [Steroidobacteraceae bacterium]
MIKEMTPREFAAARAAGADLTLLDVREDWEIGLAPVPSAVLHIPMAQVPERLAELDPGRDTVVICRSGGRSMQVARFLESKGFGSIYNLTGGILAWSAELDPSIPRY